MKTVTQLGSLLLFFTLSAFAMEGLGEFSLDLRTRYETADQDGKKDSDNLSLRIRPGFTSELRHGFQFMVEGEFTGIFEKDDYNAAGVHGDPARAVIADPENAQLEQAWLSYAGDKYSVKGGRQVIAHDGQRWGGHVGWRQNRQTFDALTLQVNPVENLSFSYSYIDKVIRIFGDEAPETGANAEEFGSDSHLLHASYKSDIGNITAYAYALDLTDSPGKIAGSNTFGLSYGKTINVTESTPLGVYLEYAKQTDADDNPQDYSADYVHARINGSVNALSYEIGYELLGADADGAGGYASVKAPLATLHKFNGFADIFLVTPDRGLEDVYVMLGYKWDLGKLGPLITKAWYHDFQSHKGGDLGDEIDAVVVKPLPIPNLPGTLSLLAKYADYQAPSGGSDLTRTSVEFNYALSF
ncbi:MAG: hypothetical protein ACI8W8_001167 [Rhodothermales bacterium]|jgi:hypothetical protein